eukprot:TRINITY_DN1649_c0_g1_i2.p1 TRINITY_DN1649_c0_g1~~TRINITY_DN1649_c0_g1_i2.p1  ORF type:complete len:482 (+),score=86.78 TRINITY_DN1649_c0_g1_i2:83-1447(+)
MTVDYISSCVAEMVGTFLLVAAVGFNVLAKNGTWGATSIASVLMVSIYAFAPSSGANFNPAVSISLGLAKKMPDGWKQVGAYCVAQIIGAVLAACLFSSVFADGIPVGPKSGFAMGAILCEVLYTFMLCFVVLNTCASKKRGKNQFFGLAIGFVIIAGGYGSAPLGAGCFNPAVALGILVSSFQGVAWCAGYIAAQLLGAVLAVGGFLALRPEERGEEEQSKEYSLASQLLGETIGTFFLVFTVGLNVLGASKSAAFSIGAALTCMIYAIGDVSGGHFNPAVTVAVSLCTGKPDISNVAGFIGAQLLGGLVGAFAYTVAYAGQTFPLGPGVGYGWTSVAIVETLFTFVLTFVVLSIAILKRGDVSEFVGFIVGACVVAGGFAAGAVSGGSLNPAVSVGVAVSHFIGGGLIWKCLAYSFFELLGGSLAAGIFRVVHESHGNEADPLMASKVEDKA